MGCIGGAASLEDAPASKRRKLDKVRCVLRYAALSCHHLTLRRLATRGVRAVQLEQAEAFLRAAGVDPSALKDGLTKKRSKKDKRDKGKHKDKHKHKNKE